MQYIYLLVIVFIFQACSSDPDYKEIIPGSTVRLESSSMTEFTEDVRFLWSEPIGPENSNPSYMLDGQTMLFTPYEIGDYEITLSIENISNEIMGEEVFYFRVISDESMASTDSSLAIDSTYKKPKYRKLKIKDNPIRTYKKDPETGEFIEIASKIKKSNNKPSKKEIPEHTIQKEEKIKPPKKAISIKNNTIKSKPPTEKINAQKNHTIQIFASTDINESRNKKLALTNKGYDAYIETLESNGKIWYRVRIGNFKNKKDAQMLANEIKELLGFKDFWIVPKN